MRRVIRHALVALVPFALASCASSGASSETSPTTELTRVGGAVVVTDEAESARECEFIADIPLQTSSASDANAMRALRNEAGRVGANLVLLVMETRTTIGRAEGYLCAD